MNAAERRGRLAMAAVGILAAVSGVPVRALTLEDVVGAALSNSPALRAAGFDAAAARARIGEAASAWMPQVRGHAQYARTDNPPQAFFMNLNQRVASLQKDFNHPDDTENLRLGFSAGWLLYDGGQRRLGVSMAELGAEARALAGEMAVNGLVHEVTRSFYGALQARDAASVAAKAVKSIEESRRLADARVQAGAAMKSDVLNLDVKLAEARQRQIAAGNGYALTIAAINSLVGADVVGRGDFDALSAAPAAGEPAAGSVTNRPEWKAARRVAALKQKAWEKSRRAYSPTVSAFGEADWDSEVSSDFEQSYLAGIAAEVALFDGARRAKGVAQAKAEWESAKAAAEVAQHQLELDLTQARLGLADATARADVARSGAASAAEALRLARQRYEQGAADISELLNAETANAASENAASAADYEIEIAKSNLNRARGLYAARHAEGAAK